MIVAVVHIVDLAIFAVVVAGYMQRMQMMEIFVVEQETGVIKVIGNVVVVAAVVVFDIVQDSRQLVEVK